MKNKIVLSLITMALVSSMALGACGSKPAETDNTQDAAEETVTSTEQQEPEIQGEVIQEEVQEPQEDAPEGYYYSELTHELIDENLKNQRPVAIMVDNEKIALPHYGLTQADVVYEMVNSMENGRITRLMCLVKDWEKIEQFGSIRSTRPTNVMLASEWNAVLCHDGGPFYIDEYLSAPYAYHLSGGFTRVNNGKSREYTEYVCTGDLKSRIESSSFGTEYDQYYNGSHFKFAKDGETVELADGTDAAKIELPFPHNSSKLDYKEEDGLYYYSEYGSAHLDPQNGNAQLSFKNVILQKAAITQLDENGYMVYNIVGSGDGYYITNGKAEPVTWKKASNEARTIYYDASGNEVTINTGKTYIAIVPADSWDKVVMQ